MRYVAPLSTFALAALLTACGGSVNTDGGADHVAPDGSHDSSTSDGGNDVATDTPANMDVPGDRPIATDVPGDMSVTQDVADDTPVMPDVAEDTNTPRCGDGMVNGSEQCDDGNTDDNDACRNNCTNQCGDGMVNAAAGETCDTAIASGAGACPTSCDDGMACTTDALAGTACTATCTHTPITTPMAGDGCCPSGATHATDSDCPASCGDGVVEAGETCDTAIASGAGACPTAASCNDSMACTADTLVSAGTCNAACSHSPITTPANGDGCCPPGATSATDSDCTAACGNGVREGTEQCDDGNALNLDGCDSQCRFEQSQRINNLQLNFATDTFCTQNALGGSIQAVAQSQLQMALSGSVTDGSVTVLLAFLNPIDLTGTTQATVSLGVLGGTPVNGTSASYNGNNDLDWWYTANTSDYNAMRVPTQLITGSFAAHVFNGGPANITLALTLGGTTPAPLQLYNTMVRVRANAVSTPTASSTGMTPGHAASEHLLPTLQSFGSMGMTGSAASLGELCGNVSAASLQMVPVPAVLLSGATACSQGYTAANSLLDVIANGCSVLGGLVHAINATQPDQTIPPGGTAMHLTTNTTTHAVTGCTRGGAAQPFPACLAQAAYSASLSFTTDRVIIH